MNILYSFVLIARFAKAGVLVSSLCVLCALCGQSSAQDFKTIHDGVEYAQVEHKLGSDPVKINLLRLDLTKVRLDVHHAMDAAIGLETTSSIAQRKDAIAAINAGFFRLDKSEFAGDAAGSLIINHKMYSESVNSRAVIGIINLKRSTLISMGHLRIERFLRVGNRTFSAGINRQVDANDLVIYDTAFGPSTIGVDDAMEFIVTKDRIRAISSSAGRPIPRNSTVIAATGTKRDELLQIVSEGKRVEIWDTYAAENESGERLLTRAEDVTNGVPQLIKNGKIEITWEQEKASKSFVETRHPRTAVAKLEDGKFLMMTVDGRQPGVSVGMSLQELAEYLLSLGAVDAMNLDGGGSTTMFLDGKVVNTPSDKEGERKIGDAILVTLRKKPATKNKK